MNPDVALTLAYAGSVLAMRLTAAEMPTEGAFATAIPAPAPEGEGGVELLLADDDEALRALLALRVALRELRPDMQVALVTADPHACRDRAREHRLPLFDKLDPERALRWLERVSRALAAPPRPAETLAAFTRS